MLRLRMHPVEPDRYHVPLSDLARGKGEPVTDPGEAIPESMLVFCGLNHVFLSRVLEVIRVADFPVIPLKAIMTPTNHTWNTRQLYEELMKEREAIAQKIRDADSPDPQNEDNKVMINESSGTNQGGTDDGSQAVELQKRES